MKYPVYTPDIQTYTTSIHKAIDDGWISSQGEFIAKATEVCKQRLGVPYVVLVNNGTSATHLLYKALRFKYPAIARIYVPDYVFVAVWNCALYEYEPCQISVLKTNPDTLNMCEDEDYVQSLEPNSAVVIVHNIGNVVNVPRLKRLRPDLVFVEDCCEAFLETYEGQYVGTASLCAAVSFFGNKTITTGEGGLWYTHDKELYDFIYRSCHHGLSGQRYIYNVLGYNYRMTNLEAALLYEQMMDADTILARKQTIYDRYVKLGLSPITKGRWMFVMRAPGHDWNALAQKGIDTRPMFYGIHAHKHLEGIEAHSDDIRHSEILMLPSSPTLSAFDQTYIAHSVLYPSPLVIRQADKPTLEAFLRNPMPSTFRYFQTRDANVQHQLTLLGFLDDQVVGYGHLDNQWIGLCVLPDFQKKGYGRLLLNFLILYARVSGYSFVRLSVDLDNTPAFSLYKSVGFEVVETTDRYYLMRKNLE